ncbi:MAG TPA: DUF5058 domain-containing protein [Erysipelotrichaceae bacterium]|nr:DUF5058 domain-containing protein [Erysipelotrichaceae bacterium]
MSDFLRQANSVPMYLIAAVLVVAVLFQSVLFLRRAWKRGRELGMDPAVLKRTIVSSATFSVLPAVGILLGVIALSGSLGTPWPWLRLSVIGALHYETQVAEAASEAVGIGKLSITHMTSSAFATIALLMSVCIMWGMILSILFNKRYTARMSAGGRKKKSALGFGDKAMTAMFIGLVSAYVGSYIGGWISGDGVFTFGGDTTPLIVAIVSACAMAVFTYFSEKKNARWLENFSVAGSMLIGMAAAVLLG